MALTVRLRPAHSSDLATLAAIELESFPDPSWTEKDFLRYDCTVAEIETASGESAVAAFLVSRQTFKGSRDAPPEREILNLAVAKRFRRQGLGYRLLEAELLRKNDVYLEVRETNAAAIHLYKKAGFTQVALRRDYYHNPTESAIVMRMKW